MRAHPVAIIVFNLLITCPIAVLGQGKITLTPIDTIHLPAGLKYEAKFNNAIRWKDLSGDNILVLSESGPHSTRSVKRINESDRDAELYAYHYLKKGDSMIQTWRLFDHVRDCDLDLQVGFLKNTLSVTDLDNDGFGEVWLVYQTGCIGSVSPLTMKIIMYQKQQKYAMRGRSKVKISESRYDGGEYNFDQSFLDAPDTFRNFARELWEKNIE